MRFSLPAVVAGLALLPVAAAAQVSMDIARSPGVTFQARPGEPPPVDASASETSPGRRGGRGPTGDDLFLANEHTYAPHDDRPVHARHQRWTRRIGVRPYYVSAAELYVIPTVAPPLPPPGDADSFRDSGRGTGGSTLTLSPQLTSLDRTRPRAAAVSGAVAVTSTVAPASPKTLYVIPRCYAGDRKPDPAQLLPGCDPARMRVIPADR